MARNGASRPTKGAITRERILEAALDVIVDEGFTAFSHRNIAARAGVQLSLTSYYFGNLDNLMLEAYRHFASNEIKFVENARANLLQQIDVNSEPTAAEIADYLADYTLTNMTERRRALSIDCKFLFEPHLPPETHVEVQRFNQSLLEILTGYMKTIKTRNPEVDANLLLVVVRSFDFQSVSDPESLQPGWLRSNLLRLISALLDS